MTSTGLGNRPCGLRPRLFLQTIMCIRSPTVSWRVSSAGRVIPAELGAFMSSPAARANPYLSAGVEQTRPDFYRLFTQSTALKSFGQADKVAAAIAVLLGPGLSYITGPAIRSMAWSFHHLSEHRGVIIIGGRAGSPCRTPCSKRE